MQPWAILENVVCMTRIETQNKKQNKKQGKHKETLFELMIWH